MKPAIHGVGDAKAADQCGSDLIGLGPTWVPGTPMITRADNDTDNKIVDAYVWMHARHLNDHALDAARSVYACRTERAEERNADMSLDPDVAL